MNAQSTTTPGPGTLCLSGRRQVFILGNCVNENGEIWCADRKTGKPIYVAAAGLRPAPTTHQEGELLQLATQWARAGESHAAWWLGWVHEGSNHPKSVWYYIAAIRRSRKTYGWLLERVLSDARYGVMCAGTPQPCVKFLQDVCEYRGQQSNDWKAAIERAECAAHVTATDLHIEEAIRFAKAWAEARRQTDPFWSPGLAQSYAAWHAGLTTQSISQSAAWRAWLEAERARQETFEELMNSAGRAGYGAGVERVPPDACPYGPGTPEATKWLEVRAQAVEALHGLSRSEWAQRFNEAMLAALKREQIDLADAEVIARDSLAKWENSHPMQSSFFRYGDDWRTYLPEDAAEEFAGTVIPF